MRNYKTRVCLGVFVGLMLILGIVAGLSSAVAQKRGGGKHITSSDLDHLPVPGADIYYQLRDEEILGTPFIINDLPYRKVPGEIIFTYFGQRRDEQGRLVFAVRIDRPPFLGGSFQLDEVPFDSSRSPGTIDFIQPGDLVF